MDESIDKWEECARTSTDTDGKRKDFSEELVQRSLAKEEASLWAKKHAEGYEERVVL